MGRAEQVTEYIRKYDDKLFCAKNAEGKLCVYRKDQVVDWYEYEERALGFVRPAPYLVFALTDDWTVCGRPVDRGLLPIYLRLRQIDLWNRDLVKDSIDSIERDKASRDRAVDNHIESFLKDNRREFARRTNDINTSILDKKIGA